MRTGILARIFTVGLLCAPHTAYCTTNIKHIFGDFYSERGVFDTDIVIHNDVRFAVYDAYVVNTIKIDNRGYIGGNINICADCILFIQNSGDFDASLNLGAYSYVTQIIQNSNEITNIGLHNDFDILVSGGADVSLGAIMSAGINADKITFDNVILHIDKEATELQNPLPEIELRGDISVVLESLDGVLSGNAVLSNVTGDGVLNFYSNVLDNFYSLQGRVENGNVYIDLVRETDYVRIFNNNIGEFLNDIRSVYPDDPLLMAMDSAPDIDSVYDVMSRSVRLHPINLMRPVRTSMAMRDMDIGGRNELGLNARFVFSSDYYIYGTDALFGLNISDSWYVSGAFGIGHMKYIDDINIFAADLYEGRLEIGYDNGHMAHRAGVGISVANFDVGPVLSENKTVYNPTGMLLHTMYEAGYRFNLLSNIKIGPVIGINSDVVRVENESDSKISGVLGADMVINDGYILMDYDYILRMRATTNRDMSASIGVRMLSHGDSVGGDILVGIMRDEFATSYNVSTKLRIVF